jgi:hypothetical protein
MIDKLNYHNHCINSDKAYRLAGYAFNIYEYKGIEKNMKTKNGKIYQLVDSWAFLFPIV